MTTEFLATLRNVRAWLCILALVLGSLGSRGAAAATVDLASIDGDSLTVTALADGTDYTNSSAAAKTLVLTNITTATTYAGTISGKIKLEVFVKSDQTLTLSGANSFTEGLEVKLGTLRVTKPEALGTGPVTLKNGAVSKLAFGASMTVPNALILNDYSKVGYATTLTVENDCQVILTGLLRSNRSWVTVNGSARLTVAGGLQIDYTEFFCKTEGVLSFAQTPIEVPSDETLKIVGNNYSYSSNRRLDIDVSSNGVSTISLAGRCCLRLNVDCAFTNAPSLTIPYDGRSLARNGGYVDLNGHSQQFGTISFAHGVLQNSLVVGNTSTTRGVFSFDQSSDESMACVETFGPVDFVKLGASTFTVTNATFSVTGCVDVAAGTLRFTGVDGSRLADSVCVREGATLDLGGHNVTCGSFVNYGGVVVNGTLSAATNRVLARAGTTVRFVDSDLAVYYPLDRADRLCVDQSFHGNADLLANGSPGCVADAKFGKAMSLDGASALTNSVFPATLPTGKDAWSTCIYLKLRSTTSKKQHPIGWGGCAMSKANFLQLRNNSDNSFDHIIWSDTSLTGKLPSGSFKDGWHSLVLTYEPVSNVRSMYFDGSCVATGAVNRDGSSRTPAVAAQDFTLGGQHNNEANWHGWLDEAAVFRRTLTAAEVAQYHTNGVTGLNRCAVSSQSDILEAEEGALLRIAQPQTTARLVGPGTIETWGLTVTKEVTGCPSVIGDVTLAKDVEFTVASLPEKGAVALLSVTGGELTCEGSVRLAVGGVVDATRYRMFVRNGVVYGQCRRGMAIILR